MSKSTPGPWVVGVAELGDRICVGQTEKWPHVCLISGDVGDETAKADARLIAAAPELLEALRTAESILWMAENYADAGGRGGPEWRDYEPAAAQIRSAIAKAEGRD